MAVTPQVSEPQSGEAEGITYSIHQLIDAGCMLEPLKCLHCGDDKGNVTYSDMVIDAYCATCGRWQLDYRQ